MQATMEVKHEIKSIPITSSELSYLWNTYLLNIKSKHSIMYVIASCNDSDIRSIFQSAQDLSAQSVNKIKKIFNEENQAAPHGFSEEDVFVNAPKVFSDKLMIYILKIYSDLGLSNYATALALSPRKDIRKFFTDIMNSTIELSNRINDICLEKGIFIKTPTIPTTEKIEFAEDKSLMGRIAGHKRPLNAMEISGVFNSSFVISTSEAFLLGIAQTVEDTRLEDYLVRVVKSLKDQAVTLNEILQKEGLSNPPNLECELLNSPQTVFSDRLSLFQAFAALGDILTTLSLSRLGTIRKDVFITFTRLGNEVLTLIKDAMNLMLERNWFEEMPKNIDWKDLTQ